MMREHRTHRQIFTDALRAVRRRIVREEWEVAEVTLEDNEDLMLGYCHNNVTLTCREIASLGYEPASCRAMTDNGPEAIAAD